MKIHLVSYACGEYYKNIQRNLSAQGKNFGWINHAYTVDSIRHDPFYTANAELLANKRGAGYWCWKPYIIYKTLSNIPEGDIMIYCDASVVIRYDASDYVTVVVGDKRMMTLATGFTNKDWCKRDCFILMKCDEPRYWNLPQLWAGVIGMRNDQFSRDFTLEWLNYCIQPNIITDSPSILGDNLDGFTDHRHDQAILTNLAEKHGIMPEWNHVTFNDIC